MISEACYLLSTRSSPIPPLRSVSGMMLKVIRKVMPGVHPEVEMGRFLTTPVLRISRALLGEVRRVNDAATAHADGVAGLS